MADVRVPLRPEVFDRQTAPAEPGADTGWLLKQTPVQCFDSETDHGSADAPMTDDAILVAAHFAKALGADGWVLTLVADPAVPVCLGAAMLDQAQVDAVVRIADRIPSASQRASARPFWTDTCPHIDAVSVFVIPVPRVDDGTCIVVNLIFKDVTDDECRAIERASVEHWPPVAAYLRLWLAARVERRRAYGIEAGLNLVAIGIVLLADDGQIVFVNDAARAIIDRHDGIREHRGQLQATNRLDAAALANAISYALAGCEPNEPADRVPLLTLTRKQASPLVVSLISVPSLWKDVADNGALAFIVDPSLDIHQLAEPVCKLFHLSRVETELTCLLASGETLSGAAQLLHVKLDTARGYLKHIFLKTGSNRQVDLVRLIFSNVVGARRRSFFNIKR